MNLGLPGRRAIVTGATAGIGRATARMLASEGATVHVVGRDADGLRAVCSELRSLGGGASFSVADLRDAGVAQRIADEAIDAMGGIDILVNVAGDARMKNVLELDPSEVAHDFSLKPLAYLAMAQAVCDDMRSRGWGRIVNVAGGGGASPTADNISISFSNVGVLNLTRALSDQLSRDGVLVNAVCPGVIDTQRARQLYGDDDALARVSATLPAGRIGLPDEVATVITFLVSAACTYVHGSSIYMDGGRRRATP